VALKESQIFSQSFRKVFAVFAMANSKVVLAECEIWKPLFWFRLQSRKSEFPTTWESFELVRRRN